MSEEILKALMQIFAIIAKQDSGHDSKHYNFVNKFLSTQINQDRVQEFLNVYDEFLDKDKESERPAEESEDKTAKRTAMKDSVRTLAICKKINKTLTQKQKVIVLIRLLEFIKVDTNISALRNEIITTVADVFKIEKNEFDLIKKYVLDDIVLYENENLLFISNTKTEEKNDIEIIGFEGNCCFLNIASQNIIFLKYQGNSELTLNSQLVNPETVYVFSHGSTLRHPKGTIYYSDVITHFLNEGIEEKLVFNAIINKQQFPNGTIALNNVHIAETTGTLFGIMGASGSGKTTLLNVLSGIDKLTDGEIKINEFDLHKDKSKLKGVIGYIPQDDLLMEDLTVFQNLYYNAELCFKNISKEELTKKTVKMLVSLGLNEIKDIKVGSPLNKKISGGQRKRLNIALELIREPQILFVDEPTSGLSSKDSENVMDLFKELSLKGKLIFVVIHQPSSDIYKMFDKLFMLDVGGFPAYYGNPIDGLLYFKRITNQINAEVGECHSCGSVNPELLFNLIESKEIDEYGNYTETRKVSPKKWNDFFKENIQVIIPKIDTAKSKIINLEIPNRLKQLYIFLKRDIVSKISNKQYLMLNLFEVPLLALILTIILRYINRSETNTYTYYFNENIPSYFFMSIVVALLVGLTVSAEEIYKDQKILKREKFLNLSRLSYLKSKVLILFTLSLIQSLFYCGISHLVLEIRDNFFEIYLIIFSVFCFANLFGLILSSTFNSPVTIYIIIPIVLIPQMLLGGAMIKYSKLNEWFGGGQKIPEIAEVMVSRWAYEGMMTTMFINNKYEKEKFVFDKLQSKLSYKLTYLLPKLEEVCDSLSKNPEDIKKLELVTKELKKEYSENKMVFITSNNADSLKSKIAVIKKIIQENANRVDDKKEVFMEQQRIDIGSSADILKLKNNHHNLYLEEVVTNQTEKAKIVVDYKNNDLIQIIDPIYQDPINPNKAFSLKTHLFSPYKFVFGNKIPTIYFNLIFIWIINLLTFVILYFDLLKKMGSLFNKFSLSKNA